jgi:hypothetical protein
VWNTEAVAELSKREVVERVLRVWEANPKLRLGQLLHNATHGVDIFYLYDDEFSKLLELYLPKSKRPAPQALKALLGR